MGFGFRVSRALAGVGFKLDTWISVRVLLLGFGKCGLHEVALGFWFQVDLQYAMYTLFDLSPYSLYQRSAWAPPFTMSDEKRGAETNGFRGSRGAKTRDVATQRAAANEKGRQRACGDFARRSCCGDVPLPLPLPPWKGSYPLAHPAPRPPRRAGAKYVADNFWSITRRHGVW
jgi:hypothetical protein